MENRLSRPGSPATPVRGAGVDHGFGGASAGAKGAHSDTLSLLPPAAAGGEGAPAATAMAAALRETLLRAEMAALVLACMGVATVFTMWPMFGILHVTGIEAYMPPPPSTMRNLLGAALLDAVYQFALLFGISITSPLWMSVGSILVVPASLVADWLLHSTTVSGQAAIGIAFIIAGFLVLQLEVDPIALLARARVSLLGAGASPPAAAARTQQLQLRTSRP